MIKTIIIEDDLMHSQSLVKILSEHFRNIDIQAVCASVPEAVQKIETLNPDLLFLDIELGPYSGFDLLEMLKRRDFEVIFTTAYQEYAIKAIKMAALDYIVKPVNEDDIKQAMARYRHKLGGKKLGNLLENFKTDNEEKGIALYDQGSLVFVKLKNIIRFLSDNSYTEVFYLEDQQCHKILVSRGIAFYEELLTDLGLFYRVHNQHLINIKHIRQLVNKDGCYVIMDDRAKTMVPVARSRKDDFILFLREHGFLF